MASAVQAVTVLFASCILVSLVPAISSAEAGRSRRAPTEEPTQTSSHSHSHCHGHCGLTCHGHSSGPAPCSDCHHPPRSCLDILKSGASTGDGFYFLSQPDGTKYRAYCDMTLDGGGWTLFGTKASVTGRYLSDTFNVDSAQATHYDSAGCIATNDWDQVMFRFADDGGKCRVVYSRHHGGGAAGQAAFDNAMRCNRPVTRGTITVGGFYRHSPFIRDCQRDPPSNFHTITNVANAAGDSDQISESFVTEENWFTLWSGATGGGDFFTLSDPEARGRKCIAGCCYKDQAVWLMYR